MKKQGHMTPQNVNSLITKSKVTEMVDVPGKECKNLLLGIANDLKENLSLQMKQRSQLESYITKPAILIEIHQYN
jgi:hypothetical protein